MRISGNLLLNQFFEMKTEMYASQQRNQKKVKKTQETESKIVVMRLISKTLFLVRLKVSENKNRLSFNTKLRPKTTKNEITNNGEINFKRF